MFLCRMRVRASEAVQRLLDERTNTDFLSRERGRLARSGVAPGKASVVPAPCGRDGREPRKNFRFQIYFPISLIAPTCENNALVSATSQCSQSFPSRSRNISTTSYVTLLPVG